MFEDRFEDFDLTFQRVGDLYQPQVSHSVVGEIAGTAFSTLGSVERTQYAGALAEGARELGERLYETVFTGEIRQALNAAQEALGLRWRDLRVRLHLTGMPELAMLPWELLYRPEKQAFFSLESPLVRFVDPTRTRLVRRPIELPLRIAVVGGAPEDLKDFEQTLEVPLRKGQVVVEFLDPATPETLRQRLRQGEFQVIHVTGHGALEPEEVQNKEQERRTVLKRVASALEDYPAGLVLLNAAFSGAENNAAESIVQGGSAAVIQTPLRGDAGRRFNSALYNQLVKGEPVETAVSDARRALIASTGPTIDWGAPALYSGVPRGESFRVVPKGSPVSISLGGITQAGDSRGTPPPGDEPPVYSYSQPKPRYLQGRFQPRVRLGDTVSLQTRIALSSGSEVSALLREFEVPPEGIDALLILYAPGFEIFRGNQRMVKIPSAADSDWVPFEMKAVRVGVHSVDVTAYAGGATLGSLVLEVTIDEVLPTSESQEYQEPFWPRLAPDEVSLSIRYDDADKVYRFMLLDGTNRPPEEVTAERCHWWLDEPMGTSRSLGIPRWQGFPPPLCFREEGASRHRSAPPCLIGSLDAFGLLDWGRACRSYPRSLCEISAPK